MSKTIIMEQVTTILSLGLLLAIAIHCSAQDDVCSREDSQVSCVACISASHLCSWCPYFPNDTALFTTQRCRSGPSSCPTEFVRQDPRPELLGMMNDPLGTNLGGDNFIQVQPQNIRLSVRRGLASTFNMTFRSVRNSPLDIYFLLDVSSSQSDVLRLLQNDLNTIARSLEEISTAFQMGFGSFIDKNILPFALSSYLFNFTQGNETTTRCRSFEFCVPTYSYRNYQPLTDNVTEIEDSVVKFARLSANLDGPEGGLEALLQVAACTKEVGWRDDSLHIVFLMTDQGYKIAGDGKLGAIVKPNDGLCHLEIGNEGRFEYTEGLRQDYPSLAQVGRIMGDNLIVPIFALNSGNTSRFINELGPAYEVLVREMSSYTPARSIRFNGRSVNDTIRVIRESYDDTIQNVRVNDPNIPGYTFTFTPVEGCNTSTDGSCRLQFDSEVTFEVAVTLDNCDLATPRTIQLQGPPFSFTEVEISPICQCPCTSEPPDVDSVYCSGRGDEVCGVCQCGEFFGDQCECNEEVTMCPSPRASDSLSGVCSGRGMCTTCGNCRCFNDSFGDACQCVVDDCPNQCSDSGTCMCGAVATPPFCECEMAPGSGFSFFQDRFDNPGNCECNPDECYNPMYPGELCHDTVNNRNGNAFCECGGCLCSGDLVASNRTCTSENNVCDSIQNCALCELDTAGQDCSSCAAENRQFSALPAGMDIPGTFTVSCVFPLGNCDYIYNINPLDATANIYYVSACRATALPWIITGSLVGAIIVLGLLFLFILKICLVSWERLEYRKFTQELTDADFAPHENPLYLTPQQDYPNPIMRRPSRRNT